MERRTELLELRPGQVAALAAAALPGAEVTGFEPLSGGFANTIYAVRFAERPAAVLRCYTRDPGCAAKEAALARLVGDALPVPLPLGHAPAGTAEVPHPVVFWSKAEGRPLRDVALTCPEPQLIALARELGRVLGRLRAFTFEAGGDLRAAAWGAPLTVAPWGFAAEGERELIAFFRHCLEQSPAGARLGAELTRRLSRYVARCAERWPATDAPATLVHADFGPQNLLVLPAPSGEWLLSAVLDWEFAHAGDPLSDAGNLLRRRDGRDLPEACETALGEGFADAGVELPEDWAAQARFLDLGSACEFLSSAEDKPASHTRAKRQIAATLERDDR